MPNQFQQRRAVLTRPVPAGSPPPVADAAAADLTGPAAAAPAGAAPGSTGSGGTRSGGTATGGTGSGGTGPGGTGPGSTGPGSTGPGSAATGSTGPGSTGPGSAATGSTAPAQAGQPGRRTRDVGRITARAAFPAADAVALVAAVLLTGAGLVAAWHVLVALAVLNLAGLHRPRICLRVSDQAGRIAAAMALAAVPLLLLVPAAQAVRLALVAAGLVTGARLVTAAALRAAHRRGALTDPTLIVGAGTFGAHLAEQIACHPELGLRVAAFLDDGTPRRDLPQPSAGQPADLARVVDELGIRRVIVCFGDWRDEDLVPVLRAGRGLPADVCVVPRLYEVGQAVPRGCLDELWGVPLIPLRRLGSPVSRAVKRAFDIAGSAVLLTLALPLLLVLAAALRLRSGQPALYRQARVTGAGREATILKLRTITDSSDGQTCWSVDARRCGRLEGWLRATHLDELPQLINVLRGEMSLVGPRPERAHFARQFGQDIPRYADRDRMPAGLTGWAQVHGLHGDTSIAERSRFDNQYIEYWSPWLDLVILARTVSAAVTGPGASR